MALDTNLFLDKLIEEGYTHLCVVPCSFAKNLINAAINNENIVYAPCASEAIACSMAAGLKMSGKKPIVIVQSSGVTNMGSCITSLLNPYGVTFPIISSWRTYKAGDSEIQHEHLATALPELIASYGYEHTIVDQDDVTKAIEQINLCDTSMTVAVLKKETFTKVELLETHILDLSEYTPRSKFLIQMNTMFKADDTLFIGTTGNTAREMYSFMPDTNNFYMAGNMGGALSLGLGAAMAGKKVVVCGGDAEFVMHMGGLSTAGRYDDINLTYGLFDNESNKSTGGQNTYQSHLDYISIAKGANLQSAEKIITEVETFTKTLEESQKRKGIHFICVKCGVDDETPRPPLDVVKVSEF